MWIVRSDLFNDMEPDIRERFIASVETAGIKMRGDDESKEGSSRGGEFFVLVDVRGELRNSLFTNRKAALLSLLCT